MAVTVTTEVTGCFFELLLPQPANAVIAPAASTTASMAPNLRLGRFPPVHKHSARNGHPVNNQFRRFAMRLALKPQWSRWSWPLRRRGLPWRAQSCKLRLRAGWSKQMKQLG